MLQETAITVRFAEGIETKQDEKGVLPTKLLVLENSVFTKAVSLVKRNGYEDLGAVVLGSDAPMLQPPRVSTGITSCRKLAGGSTAGRATFTGTANVFPATLTLTVVAPLATGRTQPPSTTATFGSALVIAAASRRSSV